MTVKRILITALLALSAAGSITASVAVPAADCVILGGMSSDQERQPPQRSFANGNAGPDDRLQMEGWVFRPAHWWLWA